MVALLPMVAVALRFPMVALLPMVAAVVRFPMVALLPMVAVAVRFPMVALLPMVAAVVAVVVEEQSRQIMTVVELLRVRWPRQQSVAPKSSTMMLEQWPSGLGIQTIMMLSTT